MVAPASLRSVSSAAICLLSVSSSPMRPLRTLLAEHTEFYLSHIEPTPVLRCVVELQSPRYAPRLNRLVRLVKRTDLVSVEIVQHHPDHLDVGICLIDQPSHLFGKVHRRASLRNLHVPPSTPCLRRGRLFGSQDTNRLRVSLRLYS